MKLNPRFRALPLTVTRSLRPEPRFTKGEVNRVVDRACEPLHHIIGVLLSKMTPEQKASADEELSVYTLKK